MASPEQLRKATSALQLRASTGTLFRPHSERNLDRSLDFGSFHSDNPLYEINLSPKVSPCHTPSGSQPGCLEDSEPPTPTFGRPMSPTPLSPPAGTPLSLPTTPSDPVPSHSIHPQTPPVGTPPPAQAPVTELDLPSPGTTDQSKGSPVSVQLGTPSGHGNPFGGPSNKKGSGEGGDGEEGCGASPGGSVSSFRPTGGASGNPFAEPEGVLSGGRSCSSSSPAGGFSEGARLHSRIKVMLQVRI